jgi:hypothetical protein
LFWIANHKTADNAGAARYARLAMNFRARRILFVERKRIRTPEGSLLNSQPDPRRWKALALLCVAFFMVILDTQW